MTSIHSYLTFNGNCREAMLFYQQCLGGELTFQTVGESPLSSQLTESMKQVILHSSLQNENLMLYASDMVNNRGLVKGNNISIMIDCSNEQELKQFYEKLSKDGIADHKPEHTFWGDYFGHLTDKYGNQWLLNCTKH